MVYLSYQHAYNTHQTSPIFNKTKHKQRFNRPEKYKNVVTIPQQEPVITVAKQPVLDTQSVEPGSDNNTISITKEPENTGIADEEITLCKQPVHDSHTSSVKSDSCNNASGTINTLNSDQNNTEQIPEHERCMTQKHFKEIEICKSIICAQQQENRELQEKMKGFMSQSKLMKAENENLLLIVEPSQDKSKTWKANFDNEITKSKKYETEIKSLKVKLSEETARLGQQET